MKKYIIILILILKIYNVHSQSMNLTDCIKYAQNNRKEILESKYKIDFQSDMILYSYYKLLPNLNISTTHYKSWGNSLNTTKYKWENSQKENGSIRLFSELIIFDGLCSFYNIKEQKYKFIREKLYRNKMINDISFEVIKNYYEVCIAKVKILHFNNFLNNSRNRLSKMQTLYRSGKISKIDILELKTQLLKEINDSITAKSNLTISLNQLKKSMGYDANKKLSISNIIKKNILINYSAEATYLLIKDRLIDKLLFDNLSKINKFKLKQIKSIFLPRILINSELNTRYQKGIMNPINVSDNYNYSNQLIDNFYKQISLNIVIPIYNRHEVKSKIANIKLKLKQNNIAKQNYYDKLYFEISKICSKLNKHKARCKNLKEEVNFYNQINKIRNSQFDKGKISTIDFLNRLNKYNELVINYKIEDYNLNYIYSILNYYIKISQNDF